MDGAYINVFIEKLRNTINEMQSKILLLETDIHFKNLQISELTNRVNETQTAFDKTAKKVKKIEDTF